MSCRVGDSSCVPQGPSPAAGGFEETQRTPSVLSGAQKVSKVPKGGKKYTQKPRRAFSVSNSCPGTKNGSRELLKSPLHGSKESSQAGAPKVFAPFFKRLKLGPLITTKRFSWGPLGPPVAAGPGKNSRVSLPVSGPNVLSCHAASCDFRTRPAANLFRAVLFIRQLALRVPIPFSTRPNFQKQKPQTNSITKIFSWTNDDDPLRFLRLYNAK